MKATIQLLLTITIASSSFAADHSHWVGTWAASPSPQLADEGHMRTAKLEFENQTLREIVHTSIGGSTLRVRLSSAYGKETITLGAAHIALHAKGPNTVAGSDRTLTFGGQAAISIPPNAPVLSDPVKLDVPASSDLVISLFFPKATEGAEITMRRSRHLIFRKAMLRRRLRFKVQRLSLQQYAADEAAT